MKTLRKIVCAVMIAAFAAPVSAQSISDILNGAGSTITNVVEGVFSKSNLKIEDLAGQWTSSGPAVCFQSDNLLKKAGGVAAAAAVETKLEPYYKQYGLNGSKLTIQSDGTFEMLVKKLTLKGNITAVDAKNGIFSFNFNVLGMNIGNLKTYVQKTSGSMDIMFDASKMKKLISAIASFSGSKLATTASKILDSYDGMCVGFGMDKTGSVSTTKSTEKTGNSSVSSGISEGIDDLFNILKGKKK